MVIESKTKCETGNREIKLSFKIIFSNRFDILAGITVDKKMLVFGPSALLAVF